MISVAADRLVVVRITSLMTPAENVGSIDCTTFPCRSKEDVSEVFTDASNVITPDYLSRVSVVGPQVLSESDA